jgi:hypothetical protein
MRSERRLQENAGRHGDSGAEQHQGKPDGEPALSAASAPLTTMRGWQKRCGLSNVGRLVEVAVLHEHPREHDVATADHEVSVFADAPVAVDRSSHGTRRCVNLGQKCLGPRRNTAWGSSARPVHTQADADALRDRHDIAANG